MNTSRAQLIIEDPAQVWLVRIEGTPSQYSPPFDETKFLMDLSTELLGAQFRGVSIDRLPVIFRSGIDVEPTDSVFYAEDFEKAWEYGGWPKVILALDYQNMKKTFLELPASTPKDKLQELRETYPTMLTNEDGEFYWLSRLDKDDPRLQTTYEYSYAWWIEGDPFEALQAIFIFLTPGQEEDVLKTLGHKN